MILMIDNEHLHPTQFCKARYPHKNAVNQVS